MCAISGISELDSVFWQIKNLAGCKNRNNNGIRNEIRTRVFTQGSKYVYVRQRQELRNDETKCLNAHTLCANFGLNVHSLGLRRRMVFFAVHCR